MAALVFAAPLLVIVIVSDVLVSSSFGDIRVVCLAVLYFFMIIKVFFATERCDYLF